MIVILLLSMVQCFRFVQSLQDKKFVAFQEKRHEKSCLFSILHIKNNHVTVKRPDKEWEGKVV